MLDERHTLTLDLPSTATATATATVGRPPRPGSLKVLVRTLLLSAAALLLLAWLLHDAPVHQVVQRAAELEWQHAAGALAGLLGCYVIRAWRLRSEWRHRLPAGRGGLLECLCMILTHNAAVLLMPLRSGEAGYLWLLHRRWQVSLADAARSLLWLRLQDAIVLALLGLLLLPPWALAARVLLLLCALVTLCTLAAALAGRRGERPASPWLRTLLSALQQALKARRNDLTGWCCSVANWTLKLMVAALLFQALSGVDLDVALRAAVGGELGGAMPLQGPAGLGTYEAGAWAALQLGQGASALPPQGLAGLVLAALSVHCIFLVIALASAAVALLAMPAINAREAARDGLCDGSSYSMKDAS